MNEWCILRMAPARTLAVAQSLQEAGVAVWTPTAIEVRRAGRARKREEREVAVLPGIVFADFGALHRLIGLSRSPGMIYRVWDAEARKMVARSHPPFSVFRHLGQYPSVSDRALAPLRKFDRRARVPRAEAPSFDRGQQVRTDAAGFDGLTGVVEKTRGQLVFVVFPGLEIPVRIAPHLLRAVA